MKEDTLICIMGPTASGKSALALDLARKLDGEIVSVDSMQLYRALPVGTAQPTAEERAEIPHHLVGIYELSRRAEVFGFRQMADAAISDVLQRGKRPILCGGTGLYFKALLYGLDDLPNDPALRARLDAEYDSDEAENALHAKMAELDPAALEKWRLCRRRLIRALEVRLITGRSLLALQSGTSQRLRYPVEACYFDPEPEILKKRIRERTDKMLASGWIDEARAAISAGLFTSPTAHQALGYRQIAAYLDGRISREALPELIATATWQYARRQRTWFRHQHPEAHPITEASQIKAFFSSVRGACPSSPDGA